MAQGGIQLDQEKLCCSICLDLLVDPVTIPCGHSYCMECIKSHWNQKNQKVIHSCPQCRQTFTPRPVLMKNTMLADLVEELKKTGLQVAPADHCYAGPGDVSCDFCTGRKLKATKSCLQCLVSYCEQHLQPHYESPAFETHKLVKTSAHIQKNICTRHNEIMKIFCRTDQQCICYLCSMDEHKDHHTVLASAERTEKQRELEVSRQKILQRILTRGKDVKVLQQEMEAINYSANKAVGDSEKIFTELIHLIQKISSDLKQQIRSRQKTEVSRVKELQEKLQQEITELRRKDAELEQLSHVEDHTQFLHNYPSLSEISESADSPNINIRPLSYFKDVMVPVSEARGKLQDILSKVWTKISLTETEVDVLLPQAEPKTRAEFLQYSCQLTLDPNTANTLLILSEGNRKASVMEPTFLTAVAFAVDFFARYNESPSFISKLQVLSRESLTGRCYWQVEWSGAEVSIAVTYKNASRAHKSRFGHNNKSWALVCSDNSYEFVHDKITTFISGPQSSRIGVYLDCGAGTLSFYAVSRRAGFLPFFGISNTMTLLHTVQTAFTQPLYAGLLLYYGSTAELCELKQTGNTASNRQ